MRIVIEKVNRDEDAVVVRIQTPSLGLSYTSKRFYTNNVLTLQMFLLLYTVTACPFTRHKPGGRQTANTIYTTAIHCLSLLTTYLQYRLTNIYKIGTSNGETS